MTIGLLKEPAGENRVALLPESVKALVALQAQIVVESSAGAQAFSSDEDYKEAGATVADRSAALAADVVVGINPPTSAETDALKAGQVLFLYFNPYLTRRW